MWQATVGRQRIRTHTPNAGLSRETETHREQVGHAFEQQQRAEAPAAALVVAVLQAVCTRTQDAMSERSAQPS
jgi:hypothetical protein